MPPRRKKVTPQTLAGEGGVAIIARRVNEMGYLWHDRRVDHGIDGEIELVSPGTRRTLIRRRVVAVVNWPPPPLKLGSHDA